MSSLTLERARANHEDIEAYERAIVAILEDKPRTNKERVWQQHRIANLIDQIRRRAEDLEGIYEDKDGGLKEEVATLRGREAFPNFYERLEQAKEYHQRFPNLPVKHHPAVHEESEPRVAFSGEEVFGKYLDLQALHAQFLALPQAADKIDYPTYLERFASFGDAGSIPAQRKNATYAKYVKALHDYLEGFLRRTQPLLDVAGEVVGPAAEARFEALWAEGKVPGWSAQAASAGGAGASSSQAGGEGAPRPVDLKNFHSAQSLEALGLERLKEGLMALGLKCGGSLQERAARLFSTKGKSLDQIDKKLLAKPAAAKKPAAAADENDGGAAANGNGNGNGGRGGGSGGGSGDPRRACAWLEFKVGLLAEALSDVAAATRKFVEKKQTRTQAELAAELREEEEGGAAGAAAGGAGGAGGAAGGGEGEEDEEEEEEDDEDGPIYNPLNLPLGFDGKPIPYWLYKLHGLSVEYKCEVCGNHSYWGRRAFDRHFQEWRHAHGMRCLGIPNTKHFHDITTIADAQALYDRIKDQLKQEQYDADKEEEFEDSEGNVLDRRTFEDLARQGLL